MPASPASSLRRARALLGTFVEIAADGDAADAIAAAFAVIADVGRLMSFHSPDSDVSRLNREAALRPVQVHEWTYQVLEAAQELHHSARCFDIDIAPLLQAQGLLPGSRADAGRGPLSRGGEGDNGIQLLAGGRVRFHRPGTRIDLGGIAKGFAVDLAITELLRHGVETAVVNAGGDIAVIGEQTIALRDPLRPGAILGHLVVADGAVATSGHYFLPELSPDAISAIVDPVARRPSARYASVSVRAPTCLLADALTKIVMVAGAEGRNLLDQHQAGAVVVAHDGSIGISPLLSEAFRHAP